MIRVQGNCPMGCGPTLFVGEGGHIACYGDDCDRPTAVSEILTDHEMQHIVVIRTHDFTIIHPLAERLDNALITCHEAADHLESQSGPPRPPGLYRMIPSGHDQDYKRDWDYTRIGDLT